MTDEEIEVVAEELAKAGGVSWYPGTDRGPLLRALTNRFRDRARVAIAALDRIRARNGSIASEEMIPEHGTSAPEGSDAGEDRLQVGSLVVYRPPGDKRAVLCRVERMEDGRAYLVPCPKPDIGWVSLSDLPSDEEQSSPTDNQLGQVAYSPRGSK